MMARDSDLDVYNVDAKKSFKIYQKDCVDPSAKVRDYLIEKERNLVDKSKYSYFSLEFSVYYYNC
jgi:hypothetical protein